MDGCGAERRQPPPAVAAAGLRARLRGAVGNSVEKVALLNEVITINRSLGKIWAIEIVKENIDVEVKFRKKAEGHYIFFKSLASTFGSLNCVTSDGMEIKSGDRVPVNSILTFAAKPVKGF